MGTVEYLSKQSKQFHTAVGFFLIAVVGIIDYLTGSEISFSIFYLIPVSLTAWFVGTNTGYLISFAGAITWLIADLMAAKPYSHSLIPYWNAIVRVGFFLSVVLLLDSLKREQYFARVDFLTEVKNRRDFFMLSDIEINRARRYNRPFTVAYIDIDNFKIINDRHGHNTGDTLLKVVAKTIKTNIRTTDTVARLGGDEFAVLLPETGTESAKNVGRNLNEKLLKKMKERKWPVTFSVGVVTFISPPDSIDEMIRNVDRVMYSAKDSGKNLIKYEVFERERS
jgi:diguanylate cyclase (GGDEF)-like protein